MIELRNKTAENIIHASNRMQVELIIDDSVNTLKNNNTNDFIIIRFLSKLEMSLREVQDIPINTPEAENVKEAIRCINKHELNKIKFDTQ